MQCLDVYCVCSKALILINPSKCQNSTYIPFAVILNKYQKTAQKSCEIKILQATLQHAAPCNVWNGSSTARAKGSYVYTKHHRPPFSTHFFRTKNCNVQHVVVSGAFLHIGNIRELNSSRKHIQSIPKICNHNVTTHIHALFKTT